MDYLILNTYLSYGHRRRQNKNSDIKVIILRVPGEMSPPMPRRRSLGVRSKGEKSVTVRSRMREDL